MAAIHNLGLAARFCGQILLLDKGRMFKFGPPDKVLTEPNIRKVFNVDSFIAHNLLTGELELHGINLTRSTNLNTEIVRVHVVGGGGNMGKTFYTLKRSGFEVTAGILHNGTNDHTSASNLGLEFASTPDPGNIEDETRAKNDRLISDADYVVVCNGIFTDINLINLRAIEACSNVLILEESNVLPVDYTGGEATKLYQVLRKRARVLTLQILVSELGR